MADFSIQHGATSLCTWNLETKAGYLHPQARNLEGKLVVRELDKLGFVLSSIGDGLEYRILVGDVPLTDMVPNSTAAIGLAIDGKLYWPELPCFESARGETTILLQSRPEDSQEIESWKMILKAYIYVVPSKVSEDSYQKMASDLHALSRSLLIDLYGKSKRTLDLHFVKGSRAYHSREEELRAISTVLDRLGYLLPLIQERPASRTRLALDRRDFWGNERLTPTGVAWLAKRGPVLESALPVPVIYSRPTESFDIPEHRITKAFLGILAKRCDQCARAAKRHMDAINVERPFRDIKLDDRPTIYEMIDLPKLKRLEDAVKIAKRSRYIIATMAYLPFLRDVPPGLVPIRGGIFQRSPEYRKLLQVIYHFVIAGAAWHEGDDMSMITKLTSRLFEQWCYLRIVDSFRVNGLDLREWNDALRQNLLSRFILDFNRGLMFEGTLVSHLRVRIRYEPWVLGEVSAKRAGESLCRGSATDVAWCPDVIIECLRKHDGAWNPVYAIVMDCKYKARILEEDWKNTSKYLQIRSTESKRQIVKQLWLISPSSINEISSVDPAVSFTANGATCLPDEAVFFSMKVKPETSGDDTVANPQDVFNKFAKGTLAFLRQEFA